MPYPESSTGTHPNSLPTTLEREGYGTPEHIRTMLTEQVAKRRAGEVESIVNALYTLYKDPETGQSAPMSGMASFEDAWRLLSAAQQQCTRTDKPYEPFLQPATGGWTDYMVRQTKMALDGTVHPDTIRGHAGYLHALAASAAIKNGLDFTAFTVPSWEGNVILPDIGLATLHTDVPEGSWGVATITTTGHEVRIQEGDACVVFARSSPGVDTPGWKSIKRVLTSLRIAEPDLFRRMLHEKYPYIPGTPTADLLAVQGDMAAALPLYVQMLTSGETYDSSPAVVGFAFALQSQPGFERIAKKLTSHPHVYRAVQRSIVAQTGRPTDPVRLAVWLCSDGH